MGERFICCGGKMQTQRRFTARELLRRTRIRVDYAVKHGPALKPIAELAELELGEALLDAYFDFADLTLSVSGTKRDLAKIWSLLRRSGFELEGSNRPGVSAPSWTGWFHKGDTGARIYLSFSSTVCKVVKVGERVQTIGVYETVCE